ncbi:hypothetical protein ANCCAN_01810 [Ancylostoma caninum]|uniref:Uncharacterized protein n=1 Tax=Ancylostoma caninum TaxID=29170 RepID=A0A368H5Z5_ANCCA|nr:hypothetical protein ANCCAN_01810 [Ancylostoma caninum]
MACSLKRLIIRKMQEKKRSDPNYQILFVLVDKKTLRLRIDKQYYSLEDASLRYGITSEEVTSELKRYGDTTKAALDKKSRTKRPGSSGNGPDNKVPRIIPLDKK